MTAHDPRASQPLPSADDHASAPAATVPLAEQVDRIERDIAAHRWLAARDDALAHGAALAAAHGALAIATAPLGSSAERDLRRAALDEAVPALAGAGLGHIADLLAAALALEMHPVSLTRARGEPQ